MLFEKKRIRKEEHDFEAINILMKYIKNRFSRQKTFTLAITGGLGSGKSYSCLSIANLWYRYFFKEEFPVENVCFSVEEIMKRFSEAVLRKGEILILEETGVAIHSKNFMSRVNRFFNYYMQAFRQKQVFVFFNMPVFSFMDKSSRILINCNMITQGIDKNKKLCELKMLFHQLNQQTGKIYPKYLRIWQSRGDYRFKVPVKIIKIPLIPENLINNYEKRKSAFISALEKDIIGKLDEKTEAKPVTHEIGFQKGLWKLVKQYPLEQLEFYAKRLNIKPEVVLKNLYNLQNRGYAVGKLLHTINYPPKNSENKANH